MAELNITTVIFLGVNPQPLVVGFVCCLVQKCLKLFFVTPLYQVARSATELLLEDFCFEYQQGACPVGITSITYFLFPRNNYSVA